MRWPECSHGVSVSDNAMLQKDKGREILLVAILNSKPLEPATNLEGIVHSY